MVYPQILHSHRSARNIVPNYGNPNISVEDSPFRDLSDGRSMGFLKNISKSVNGYSFKSDDFDREYDIPVIRIGDVGDIIDFEDCIKVKSDFLKDKKDFIVCRNDILIGLTGGTIGKSGRYNYDTPSLLNQRVGLLRNSKYLLNDSVRLRMRSDVPIGAFLSGGLDSTSIVGEMSNFTELQNLHTFSIGFEEKKYDESLYIKISSDFQIRVGFLLYSFG